VYRVEPPNVLDTLVQLFRCEAHLVKEVLVIMHDPVDAVTT
jgi:hypothetical protein